MIFTNEEMETVANQLAVAVMAAVIFFVAILVTLGLFLAKTQDHHRALTAKNAEITRLQAENTKLETLQRGMNLICGKDMRQKQGE